LSSVVSKQLAGQLFSLAEVLDKCSLYQCFNVYMNGQQLKCDPQSVYIAVTLNRCFNDKDDDDCDNDGNDVSFQLTSRSFAELNLALYCT